MIHSFEELTRLGPARLERWGREITELLHRPDAAPCLVLSPEFLRTWLRGSGLEERVLLAFDRLPERPEPLESWDHWLSLQRALLGTPLPENLSETLRRRLADLPRETLRVCGSLPTGALAGPQRSFSGLRSLQAVLEAVRLAWAAVLCAQPDPARLPEVVGAVLVRPAGQAATGPDLCRQPAGAAESASAPDRSLLRLGELHGRLSAPGETPGLAELLDLGTGAGGRRPFPPALDAAAEERFLRRALASGFSEAGELLVQARVAWRAWVEGAGAGSPAGRGSPGTAGKPERIGPRQLVGTAASPGLVRGVARVIREADLPRVLVEPLPEEVLVCRALEARLSSAALSAAGLVTEQGGTLSYGAVLAARAGIPCVCGVREATRLVREGETLLLEGHLGIVGIERFR